MSLIENLPWWTELKLHHFTEKTEKDWQFYGYGGAWVFWEVNDLKNAMRRYPLSSELAEDFIKNHVSEVSPGILIDRTYILASNVGKFKIHIAKEAPRNEQLEGFSHEIVHGVYRANDAYQEVINNESMRFYKSNGKFLESLLDKNLKF